jgi:SAM-dependent methyltransferase
MGTLRRLAPVDRHYIGVYLDRHRADIRGRVLEILDDSYARRYGTSVTEVEVLDIDASNARATIVADLADCDHVPGGRFDCVVLTQTLQLIPDVRAAVRNVHRLLAPGGVLLATVPVISRIVPRYGLEMDHWRFTPASSRLLFGDAFGADNVRLTPMGNHLAAVAFLTGMAREELRRSELEGVDPYFPVVIGVRAVKGADAA